MTEMLVTYPAGSTLERSMVAAVTRSDGHALFAVARTPCHPESPRWPDQPADRCTLECNGTQTAISVQEGHLPDEEPCVLHSVPIELAPAVGEEVTLHVDERRREALSRSHSRCHLVSLALNAELREAWRKEPPARDSLGNPDFDKLAIVSSRIDEGGSLDSYRVGKHVRKSGFSVEALGDLDLRAARSDGELPLRRHPSEPHGARRDPRRADRLGPRRATSGDAGGEQDFSLVECL